MATRKKVKKPTGKKSKSKDMHECISCLRELHNLQGVLLKELARDLLKKI